MSTSESIYRRNNDKILHANEAFDGLFGVSDNSIKDPQVTELARELITNEQQTAIDEMNDQYDIDIATAEVTAPEARERAEALDKQIAMHEKLAIIQREELGRVAEFYSEASGQSFEEHDRKIRELSARRDELLEQKELPYEGNEELYEAWVIPKRSIIDPDSIPDFRIPDLRDYFNPDKSLAHDVAYIDEFPDTAKFETISSIKDRLHEWKGRMNDAGHEAVYVMVTNPNVAHTCDMIGDELYSHKERDPARRKANAGSLMSNFVHGYGSTIPRGLTEAEIQLGLAPGSLKIDVGRRWQLRNGRKFGTGERIFRIVVPGTDFQERLNQSEHPDFIEAWDCDYDQETAVSPAAGELGAVATCEIGLEMPRSSQEEDVQAAGANEKSSTIEPDAANQEGHEKRPWFDSFRDSVRTEIDRLIENGLDVNIDDIPTKILHGFNSKTLGTKECFARGVKNGILTSTPKPGSAIDIEQLVALSIQNAQSGIFSQRARRSVARQIIQEEIAAVRERLRTEKGM